MTRIAVLALVVLVAAGCTGDGEAAPAPTVTVTEPAPTVTVTAPAPEPVQAAPQACLDALDEADAAYAIAEEITSSYTAALEALEAWDFRTVRRRAAEISAKAEEANEIAPRYNEEKAACRAAR